MNDDVDAAVAAFWAARGRWLAAQRERDRAGDRTVYAWADVRQHAADYIRSGLSDEQTDAILASVRARLSPLWEG